MKYLLLAQILFVCCVAFAGDGAAVCQLTEKYILARNTSGIAQFSNVGDIEITCSVPERPFPTKPGDKPLWGLKVSTKAYQFLENGQEKLVPSETNVTGGMRGFGPVPAGQEGAIFSLHVPLEPSEQQAEAERLWERIQSDLPQEKRTQDEHRKALQRVQALIYQHRVGRFRVECSVMDGTQVLGTGTVQIEIVFKGRFSDLGLPAAPPV